MFDHFSTFDDEADPENAMNSYTRLVSAMEVFTSDLTDVKPLLYKLGDSGHLRLRGKNEWVVSLAAPNMFLEFVQDVVLYFDGVCRPHHVHKGGGVRGWSAVRVLENAAAILQVSWREILYQEMSVVLLSIT